MPFNPYCSMCYPQIPQTPARLLWPGYCMKAVITQEPRSIIIGTGSAALMRCEQETTDYEWMFWYRQREGQGVQLVSTQLRGDQPTYEEGYRTGFHVNRTARDKISFLEIQVPKRQDQGVYLCAA
ncbi:hypothetical protein XENTR_v10017475, partial [Xenopus tropicalis]